MGSLKKRVRKRKPAEVSLRSIGGLSLVIYRREGGAPHVFPAGGFLPERVRRGLLQLKQCDVP